MVDLLQNIDFVLQADLVFLSQLASSHQQANVSCQTRSPDSTLRLSIREEESIQTQGALTYLAITLIATFSFVVLERPFRTLAKLPLHRHTARCEWM